MTKKSTTVYVCSDCGYESIGWIGQCTNCKAWNTLVEFKIAKSEVKANRLALVGSAEPLDLWSISKDTDDKRYTSGFQEFDLVLGGGFIADQVVLLGGEPGIGKSTLSLQVAMQMAEKSAVLYVSAEETAGQVSKRAIRIAGNQPKQNLKFINSADLEQIFSVVDKLNPKIVVIDSIQTIYDPQIDGVAGNIAQVRSCAAKLVTHAKQKGYMLVIISHINKDGELAGPKLLEHLVDTVLQFEAIEAGGFRMVRSLKNRYGQVGEVGILVMGESGLLDIGPEHNLFIDGSEEQSIGTARTVVMDGSRAILVEIQALVSPTIYAYPKRVADGLNINRVQTMAAILSKFTKLNLNSSDIYIKITGGYKVIDQSSDLALAQALISSALKRPNRLNNIYIGEVNLAGKVMPVGRVESRIREAARFRQGEIYASNKVQGVNKITAISELI